MSQSKHNSASLTPNKKQICYSDSNANTLMKNTIKLNASYLIEYALSKFERVIKIIYTRLIFSLKLLTTHPRSFPVNDWKIICYTYRGLINHNLRREIFQLLKNAHYNGFISHRDANECLDFLYNEK